MSLSGASTAHGIPNFGANDRPDLAGSRGPGLPDITAAIDALIGAYKIADTTLGSAASQIVFSAIPQNFAHLMLVVYLRGDVGSALSSANLRANADATADYDFQGLRANGATIIGYESIGATSTIVGDIPGGLAGAGIFGAAHILVPHYAGAVNGKSFESVSSAKVGVASGNIYTSTLAGFWRGVSNITTLTLIPASGNFVTGSRATLYGLA